MLPMLVHLLFIIEKMVFVRDTKRFDYALPVAPAYAMCMFITALLSLVAFVLFSILPPVGGGCGVISAEEHWSSPIIGRFSARRQAFSEDKQFPSAFRRTRLATAARFIVFAFQMAHNHLH